MLRSLFVLVWSVFAICVAPLQGAEPAVATSRNLGPWDMAALKKPTKHVFGAKSGLVTEVFYESVPYQGKPTRVFAYLGLPEGTGPFPAMLCVHGGGGKAFREWAELWAKRGYVALAMDTAGNGPDGKRLVDGGPDQSDVGKFGEFTAATVGDMWTYHAVAAVVRGHSFLAAQAEVDPSRIGITGISWGGYLTCIVTGIDDRLKVSVPVYGCGFLDEDSVWLPRFAKMSPELKKRWVDMFDPSRYLAGATCPMLFVNGTNDFAYPLGSYKKSYELPTGPVSLCIRVRMPHGHPQGWAPAEISLFVDSILKQAKPLAKIGPLEVVEGNASAKYGSSTPIKTGELHYAVATGTWQKREWKSIPAVLDRGTVRAVVPHARPIVAYLTVTDERGALVSTPHVVIEK
ncbi:MAG: acetylxylan esterase [Planctomycetia bacterium]|nr:acetylxylan esterase [Planctomycetia bacterium]